MIKYLPDAKKSLKIGKNYHCLELGLYQNLYKKRYTLYLEISIKTDAWNLHNAPPYMRIKMVLRPKII